MACDPAGDSGRLAQERAEGSKGAELDGKPEPHVTPTLGAGWFAIGIVEVEVLLGCSRRARPDPRMQL